MRVSGLSLLAVGFVMACAALTAGVKAADHPVVCVGCPFTPPPPPPPDAHGFTVTKHELSNFVPVTDEMLAHPKPVDWMMFRGRYQGWGFSPLSQVNKKNVRNLALSWARVMEPGVNESTPLVINGIMFLGNSSDVIQAIDAVTGDLQWEYRRRLPPRAQMHNAWGDRKRSIFVYGDKVYFATWDNFIVALDARTGKEVWETDRGGDLYATNTAGPIVVHGVVIAGANCQNAGFGCYVTGHDANTGKELWRNTFIPKPGEPGDETWGGVPFEKRWITGAWGPITYDPDLGLIYYGSSGIGPASEAQRGQIGMSLAGTDTRFAVHPADGAIAWKHQVLPEDNWDEDCVHDMMTIDTAVAPDPKADGMMAIGEHAGSSNRKVLVGAPCKNGMIWSFDAASGKFLFAKQTIFQNMVKSIDSNGAVTINPDVAMRDIHAAYHVCPTSMGGRDEGVSAYSPQTHMLYLQMQNLCWDKTTVHDNVPKPSDVYNIASIWGMQPGKTNIGRIDAIDIRTGKTMWNWETPVSNYAPVLATGGGLVFNGGMDRYFRALDAHTGKQLWQTRLASEAFGTPVSFSVKGRQYIAIAGGGGFNPNGAKMTPDADIVSGGNAVYVFALPQ